MAKSPGSTEKGIKFLVGKESVQQCGGVAGGGGEDLCVVDATRNDKKIAVFIAGRLGSFRWRINLIIPLGMALARHGVCFSVLRDRRRRVE